MIAIDKNVPMPEKQTKRYNVKYPFSMMLVGDSFVVDVKKGETVRDAAQRIRYASAFHRKKNLLLQFSVRPIDNNTRVRCWRVADKVAE
jgi:DNA modification methylase